MTRDIFKSYLKTTVKRLLIDARNDFSLKDCKSLFIIDNFSGHIMEEKERVDIEKELNIIIKYLRPYTASLVQPLDLSINYLLKHKLKQEWLEWFIKKDNPQEKAKYPSKQDIYNWFARSWRTISPPNIVKAFLHSGISNSLDNSEDFLCRFLSVQFQSESQPKSSQNIDQEEKDFYKDIYEEVVGEKGLENNENKLEILLNTESEGKNNEEVPTQM